MKVLLTGGAGYVGSACLRWLVTRGHDAVAYDDMSLGNQWAVPKDRLIVGDILDQAALTQALQERDIEGVIHFAARAVVPESVDDPATYWQQNLNGTKSVLEAMRECQVNRIILSSTCALYGENPPTPIKEDTPIEPSHPYGRTKAAAEWMIEDYSRAYGIGYTHLRYFNACGADPDGEFGESRSHETHLIPLILQAATGQLPKFKICGDDWPTRDGTCIRDYIHTDDLAQAHQLALETITPPEGRVYNVGTGQGTTVLEVFRACEEVVGQPLPHEIAPRRPGDPAVLYADSTKIRNELGWTPAFPNIRDIVETAWRWHQREASAD